MKLKSFALRGMGILAVVVALCLLLSGTVRSLTTPKVRYAPVRQGKFENVIELKGQVVFPASEEISLELPEGLTLTVSRVQVSAGQQVKAGDKLLSAKVADLEKTIASLQQEVTSAQNTLDAWERKNGDIKLTSSKQRWLEAYEALQEATTAEREARLTLQASLGGAASVPETLPEDASEETTKAYAAWQEASAALQRAKEAESALSRHAIPEDTWSLLQQKWDAEKKRDEAEEQIMSLMLWSRRVENITAPHDGYITALSVEKGATLSGDTVLMSMTPEGTEPVIRVDISDVKQGVQKGTTISVNSNSWGRVETKVVDLGLGDTGHPYADAEITQDVIYALGKVSAMMKEEIGLRLTVRAQEATSLVPASAVRGSGDGRYVFIGNQQSSAFAGTTITVQKMNVTVLAESASLVSVAEDLNYQKVLYMEDRAISEGSSVMLYEE